MKSRTTAVDLFCGVGGLTHGLIRAGIDVVAGIDRDPTCKCAYEINNRSRFIESDVRDLPSRDVAQLYPPDSNRILAGCAPCQPFSSYTQRYKQRVKSEDWGLLYEFSRFVHDLKPVIVTMENVPQLRDKKPFLDLLCQLERMKYSTSYKVVNCADYGVPQHRRRLVLLASALGEIDLIPANRPSVRLATVREWIGGLESLKAGCSSKTDSLHRCQRLTDINLRRIRASRPGGTWLDWNEKLRTKCHRKASGISYSPVYGRMEWDKPAPTITTQFYNYGSGRFGHPDQNRAVSLREGALLQSFPGDYVFTGPEEVRGLVKLGEHIGNAVPVMLGEAIGKSMIKNLEEHGYAC